MNIKWDDDIDAAIIHLKDDTEPSEITRRQVVDSGQPNCPIALDYDAAGKLIAIEVHGASVVLHAETLDAAEVVS